MKKYLILSLIVFCLLALGSVWAQGGSRKIVVWSDAVNETANGAKPCSGVAMISAPSTALENTVSNNNNTRNFVF